jgi:GNAT superfamily N-acetyltransferase
VTTIAITVRPAVASDDSIVRALATAAGAALSDERGGVLHREHDLDGFDPVAHREGVRAVTLAGMLDDVVLGYACVEAVDHDQAVLRALYVDPAAREVGLGETLIGSVLEWCREQRCVGLDAVALPGDRETKNFFETQGLVARAITVHRDL